MLFDPVTIIDTATYDDPKQEPEGIDLVVVNGQVSFKRDAAGAGVRTGVGGGQLLRFNS